MAEKDDFKIKGAAQKNEIPENPRVGPKGRPDEEEPTSEQAEAQQGRKVSDHFGDQSDEQDAQEEGELTGKNDLSDEDKYKWYRCVADETEYGKDAYYWLHAVTRESRWIEPDQPYWIYDPLTCKHHPVGLQFPSQPTRTREEVMRLDPVANWGGYNPKIHGDYDPNADYAKFHESRRVEEAAASNPFDTSATPLLSSTAGHPYQSAMSTNRFSGHVQSQDVGPERHSDAAKSGRQLNAFFDVDAAANAHDGRSLKKERQQQKLSKDQVNAYKIAKKEKKAKKQRAFLTS